MIDINKYNMFLKILEKRISEKEFEEKLLEVQKIDGNHYRKRIMIKELKKDIEEYRNKEIKENNFENMQILLIGNPDIVFKICLEAIRYNVNIIIGIEDFCYAQNVFIIEFMKEIYKECKFKNKIEIKNLLKDIEIINNSQKVDKTICIGNSNLYHRLDEKINNLYFYPYGIFEIYTDSDEFELLKETILEISMQNSFELDFYDELNFDDAVQAINRDGYKFCSLLISKDINKIQEFKNKIEAKYVMVNENPFKQIKFVLEIK